MYCGQNCGRIPPSCSFRFHFASQRIGESAEHSEKLRLTGPAVETLSLEADIDAADQLEFPDQHQAVLEAGIAPQLAVLESLINLRGARVRCHLFPIEGLALCLRAMALCLRVGGTPLLPGARPNEDRRRGLKIGTS